MTSLLRDLDNGHLVGIEEKPRTTTIQVPLPETGPEREIRKQKEADDKRSSRLLGASDKLKNLSSSLHPRIAGSRSSMDNYGEPFKRRFVGAAVDGRNLIGGDDSARGSISLNERTRKAEEEHEKREADRHGKIDKFLDDFEGNVGSLMPHSDDYPKWIEPHESHLVKFKGRDSDGNEVEHVVVPSHEFHTDRAGKTTVLVSDEDDEKIATSAKKDDPKPDGEDGDDAADKNAEADRQAKLKADKAANDEKMRAGATPAGYVSGGPIGQQPNNDSVKAAPPASVPGSLPDATARTQAGMNVAHPDQSGS